MYAWCVAIQKNGVQLQHEAPPKSKLISQPPHDWVQGEACMLHYTWGTLYNKDGKEFWRFDKRDWTAKEHELKVSNGGSGWRQHAMHVMTAGVAMLQLPYCELHVEGALAHAMYNACELSSKSLCRTASVQWPRSCVLPALHDWREPWDESMQSNVITGRQCT